MASWSKPPTYSWRCESVCFITFPCILNYYVRCYRVNILIDRFYTGKLGDFGFTREFPLSTEGHTMVTTACVAKSLGYSPPEMDTCHLSPKSDVYSYGIVCYIVAS